MSPHYRRLAQNMKELIFLVDTPNYKQMKSIEQCIFAYSFIRAAHF